MPPTPRQGKTPDHVSFEGMTIEYRVRRSPRRKKTIEFSLTPDGLLVSAPARASYALIRSIVLRRAPQILKLMADSPHGGWPLSFSTGDSLPYLGRDIEIFVEDGVTSSTQVCLREGAFHLSVRPTLIRNERQDSIRQTFAAWYRARAQEHIPALVDDWSDRMGLNRKLRVLIGNQRSRWGSCSSDGTLRFSWRTMMLPPDVVEYIVVHELSHLSVMGHSPKFWNVVARVLPDVQRRRKLLRETGTALPL